MRLNRIVGLGLPAVALLLTGCETTGGSQVETAVFDTQRRVARLDNTLESSVTQLNQTTATLAARTDETEQQMRRVHSLQEENQAKLDQLARDFAEFRSVVYRRWDITPGAAAQPRPPQPVERREAEVEGVIVESPNNAGPGAQSTVVAPPTGAPAGDHKAAYLAAQRAWVDEDFPRALQLFTQYLDQHEGRDADDTANARFWRARSLLKLDRYDDAIRGFEQVRTQHPNSDKTPSAMHNEAVAYARLGQHERAEQLLQEVINNYPATSFAEESRRALEQLRGMR